MDRLACLALVLAPALVACSPAEGPASPYTSDGLDSTSSSGDGDGDDDPGESSSDDASDASDASEDATDDAEDSSDETETGIKFDFPANEDTMLPETPCGVDILFIVDNSGSMSQHKDNIVAAFDSFVAEMVAALEPGTPVHVGVTRATGFFNPGNGSGWGGPACEFSFLDGTWYPPDQGNSGINGQQGRLYEYMGQRYHAFATDEDPGELASWFQGALAGAIANDQASNSESVVAGAAYPFHPANAAYNDGFLREKAVLVLFLLSDAPDATPDTVATQDLIDLVSEAKAGCGDGCILPTGVIQGVCYDNPQNTNTRLTEFVNGFGAPPVALDFFTISDPPASFTSVLGATLAESIAYTCEEIVPVG